MWDYKDARNTDLLSTKDIRNYSNYGGIADLLKLGWRIGLADRTTGKWVNGPFAMKANKQGTRFVSNGKKDHTIVARRSKADGWFIYPLRYKYWGQMPANRVVCIAPPSSSSDR